MANEWQHPRNDGSMRVRYELVDDADRNAALSHLLNEMCHVFHDHADGNWRDSYKDAYARQIAAAIAEMPYLTERLLGTGDRVIRMVTYRALELVEND